MKIFGIAAAAVSVLASASASAQISQVAYASLTGTQIVDFEDLVAGTNYDTLIVSNGVGLGERFAGQVLGSSGDFDTLSGTPSGPLTQVAGAANRNVSILLFSGSNVLTGLGPVGFPSANAIGEGAFSVLFSSDQSQFGFQLVGGNSGPGDVSFFRADGSLIQVITLPGLANSFYGFSRDGGIKDIRGISITNLDPAGVGFDNLKFDVKSVVGPDVPEPATWAMLIAGFGLVGAAARRRRGSLAAI